MSGTEVSSAIKESIVERIKTLRNRKIYPKLNIIRVGEKPEDISYEKAIRKSMDLVGIKLDVEVLSSDVEQEELMETLLNMNEDSKVHGIMIFRPLPDHINEDEIAKVIDPRKDVDCISKINMEKIMEGGNNYFAPCTAQAVMEMLDFYNIDIQGKDVTILGRSMVVGKPLSMMMLNENATITICHSKTGDLKKHCRSADILVSAIGKAEFVTEDFIKRGSIVIDVGINVKENGKLCGDVDYNNVAEKTSFISPVPGGVGAVTASVLAKHVVSACENLN